MLTRPLRVAHVLLAGDVDGIGLHVLDLARAQRDSGTVEPVVVTRPSPPYARRLRRAGVAVHVLRSPRVLPSLVDVTSAGWRWRGADVTHLHGHRAGKVMLLSRLLHLPAPAHPVVATCHGLLHHSVRHQLRSRAELASYRHVSLVVVTSRELADLVAVHGSRPQVVHVPNGVAVPPPPVPGRSPVTLARYGIPAAAPVVGAVGRLAPEKRHEVFLRTCRLIADERPDAHFLLAGDGPERDRLQALAVELGLADRVHLPGLVEEAAGLSQGLALLLHTSSSEGTPRAVLEAMAAGVPVVATTVGGVPEQVVDGVTGLLAPPEDPPALARAALSLLADPQRAQRMGELARARVESCFGLAAMAAQIEALYRELLPAPIGSTA